MYLKVSAVERGVSRVADALPSVAEPVAGAEIWTIDGVSDACGRGVGGGEEALLTEALQQGQRGRRPHARVHQRDV